VIFKREKERNLKTYIQITERGEMGKNTMHLNSRIPNNQYNKQPIIQKISIPGTGRRRQSWRWVSRVRASLRCESLIEVGIFVVVDGDAAGGVVCVALDLAGDFEG
jgi:hypothetical protein